ncbi:MAG: response regulator [Bacteroidales bacterium]|nr:response regulator [Bacteroidales bacterium]
MKTYTILIADDEIENLQIIEEALLETDFDHRLIMVVNGKIMVEFAEKRIPDLIITDWEMPEMNGIEAIKELKKKESTKDIPIIMCTGIMTSSANLETALTSGAIDYIRKPIDKIELVARVSSMLKLADSIRATKAQNAILKQQKNEIQKQQEVIIKHETDEIKKLLKRKKTELKKTKLRLINYNLSISKFISDIKSLSPYVNKEGAKKAQVILANYMIENNEITCNEIEIHFKEAHNDSYEKLKRLYPDLTQSEKRICLFLILKMDTKQIADILYKSIRTIEGLRTNIRKKLNMDNPNENLQTFLANLQL